MLEAHADHFRRKHSPALQPDACERRTGRSRNLYGAKMIGERLKPDVAIISSEALSDRQHFVSLFNVTTHFRKYLSIFLLAVFVFPFIQKGIHDLEHRDDVYCTEKSQVHLHKAEHVCSLCDYNIPLSDEPVKSAHKTILLVYSAYSFPYTAAFIVSGTGYRIPPRAPPAG